MTELEPGAIVLAVLFILGGPAIWIFRRRLVAFSNGVDGRSSEGQAAWRTRIAVVPLVLLPLVGVLVLTGVINVEG